MTAAATRLRWIAWMTTTTPLRVPIPVISVRSISFRLLRIRISTRVTVVVIRCPKCRLPRIVDTKETEQRSVSFCVGRLGRGKNLWPSFFLGWRDEFLCRICWDNLNLYLSLLKRVLKPLIGKNLNKLDQNIIAKYHFWHDCNNTYAEL